MVAGTEKVDRTQLEALLGLPVMEENPAAKISLEGAKARLNGIVIPEPK